MGTVEKMDNWHDKKFFRESNHRPLSIKKMRGPRFESHLGTRFDNFI